MDRRASPIQLLSMEYQKWKLNIVAEEVSHMMGRFCDRETNSYMSTVEGNMLDNSRMEALEKPLDQEDEPK